jgi:hypothetical protein
MGIFLRIGIEVYHLFQLGRVSRQSPAALRGFELLRVQFSVLQHACFFAHLPAYVMKNEIISVTSTAILQKLRLHINLLLLHTLIDVVIC